MLIMVLLLGGVALLKLQVEAEVPFPSQIYFPTKSKMKTTEYH